MTYVILVILIIALVVQARTINYLRRRMDVLSERIDVTNVRIDAFLPPN